MGPEGNPKTRGTRDRTDTASETGATAVSGSGAEPVSGSAAVIVMAFVSVSVTVPVSEPVAGSVPVSVPVTVSAPPSLSSRAERGLAREVEGSPERSPRPGHRSTLHGRVVADEVLRWERREEGGFTPEPLLPASPAIPARDSLGATPAATVAATVAVTVTVSVTVSVPVTVTTPSSPRHPEPRRGGDTVVMRR